MAKRIIRAMILRKDLKGKISKEGRVAGEKQAR